MTKTNTENADKHRFENACDSRGRAVRGLWVRNKDRYYVQLRVPGPDGFKKPRRVPLKARSLSAAVAEAEEVRVRLRSGEELPSTGRKPLLSQLIDRYLEFHDGNAAKRRSTMIGEKNMLKVWRKELGGVRVDRLNRAMILGVIEKRAKEGRSNRTINHSVVVVRNVLRYGQQLGFLQRLPSDGITARRVITRHRECLRPDEVNRLCTAAITECPRTGELLSDFLRFLAYSGAREQEAIRTRWQDVSFDRKQVVIGADGYAKAGRWRVVDFNPALESHLRDMTRRRVPDSAYLFPSPRRTSRQPDRPAKRLRGALEAARTVAGLPTAGFHDLRRFFISYAVMSRVPSLTIAKWVGHDSGTVLIDRVYAHLTPDHMSFEAAKLSFTDPVPVSPTVGMTNEASPSSAKAAS